MAREELQSIGITALSEMQETACHEIGQGKSVVLLSPTGTGKTLAYLCPMLDRLSTDVTHLQAVVILPSRELALQTFDFFFKLKSGLRATTLCGGHSATEEQRKLKDFSPQVIFATPGRFLDHLQRGNIETANVGLLVIDEYDKCLELGFKDDLQSISQSLQSVEQYVFTSATSTNIPNTFFPHQPQPLVTLDFTATKKTSKTVNVVYTTEYDRLNTLALLLSELQDSKTIVFVSQREDADRVGRNLKSKHFFAETYHGGMEQRDRERALYKFRSNCSNILVSTDLAARGMDIPDVTAVIHFQLPHDEKAFVHRNGRTERWTSTGKAFAIITPEETIPAYISNTETYNLHTDSILVYPPEFVALYIGRGKKDKLGKGDIVGFLCQAGNLSKDDIGEIEVGTNHIYVAINKQKTDNLLKSIAGQKIKGKKTLIELMRK